MIDITPVNKFTCNVGAPVVNLHQYALKELVFDMIQIITEKNEWQSALQDTEGFDFYHTYDYHQSEKQLNDLALLVRYQLNSESILLPIILRNIQASDYALQDITSVYGYAGPIARCHNQSTVQKFSTELVTLLKGFNVVSLFARLHPLFNYQDIISNLGTIEQAGSTVSIDLTEPADIQRMKMRRETKYKLNKLRKAGIECRKLDWATDGQEFIAIYEETMRRLKASERYFFSKTYFDDFFKAKSFDAHLFGCFLDDKMLCAGIFTGCHDIVQYHLGGTRDDSLTISPARLMFDTVRLWATDLGYKTFHLGGGLGGNKDSLYQFKKGFSKTEHPFYLWKWVIDQRSYHHLCQTKNLDPTSDFFPAYRCPAPVKTDLDLVVS